MQSQLGNTSGSLISIAITQFLLTAERKQPNIEKGLTNDMAAME